MTKNWERFQNQNQPDGDKPQGREIGGMYQCQFCPVYVTEATYYPTDGVLRYKCSEGHVSFLENFRVAF